MARSISVLGTDLSGDAIQIASRFRELGDQDLEAMLNTKSIVAVSHAAHELIRRKRHRVVFNLLCEHRIKWAMGRKIALFYLHSAAPTLSLSKEASLRCLADKSSLVVGEAIWDLVHWMDVKTIPALELIKHPDQQDRARLAVRAIRARDISIMSSGYRMSKGWQEFIASNGANTPNPNVGNQ